MTWINKGLVILALLLAACAHTSTNTTTYSWLFRDYDTLKSPINIRINRFKHTTQSQPIYLATKYISEKVGCSLFEFTSDIDDANVFVEDHQKKDDSGAFVLPLSDDKRVLADASSRKYKGRRIYVIRVYAQEDLERQTRIYIHEILHVLKIGHDDVQGSVMNPLLSRMAGTLIPAYTLKALNSMYCQGTNEFITRF